MTRIISVVNQKGGVGKTTTTISVSATLAEETGKKILAVDLDPQGNCSSGFGMEKNAYKKCIYNCLIDDTDPNQVIQATGIKNLDILPASIQLAGAEIELVGELSRENKLKRALKILKDKYDYILIDCPPSLGLLTVNALTASTDILIPLQCEYFALEGLTQLLNTINLIQADLNPDVSILGILLTMADNRTNLTTQIIEEVTQHFPQHVFKSVITRNVRLSEAPSHGLPINHYDKKSTGAQNYLEFTREMLTCLNQSGH
ncbi:MAG: ParA family protein [Candidatus Cloacimonetes bacterium]|nr:ParA family protein [Candidatus Cloacimonadota bacterium]